MASFCTFEFTDCFSPKEGSVRRQTLSHGIEREMAVLYNQPHLVEPMKLRVYEDLPTTPITAQLPNLSPWNLFPQRNIASRASSQASRFSMRKMLSRSGAAKPIYDKDVSQDLPLRRRQQYRPLELSIYVEENRLSDLPEFSRLSFTDGGELKPPPKALIRHQSVQLPETEIIAFSSDPKPASMYEVGTTTLGRPSTSCSIVSTSRPPSEYDALHSHPVSWTSLPGLAVSTKAPHKVECSVAILTPMQEEFAPEATAVVVDSMVLKFPQEDPRYQLASSPIIPDSPEIQAPYPVVSRGPSRTGRSSVYGQDNTIPPYFHTNYQTQKRISQWLQHRGPSPTSTIRSNSTTASFAEHRRKRSQFYQLGKQQPSPRESPPMSLQITTNVSMQPLHQRTATESTAASTVDTDVLSFGFSHRPSEDSMTTTSYAELKSRTGTIKSVSSPGGYKVAVAQVKELGLSPSVHADIHHIEEENEEDEVPFLEEIGGPLRSPGVGIAF